MSGLTDRDYQSALDYVGDYVTDYSQATRSALDAIVKRARALGWTPPSEQPPAWTSPNGVHHTLTDSGRCMTCGRRHPAQRAYIIGLPVLITVDDDGTVALHVDGSEAADLWDASQPDGQAVEGDTLVDDAAAVTAAVANRTATVRMSE